MQAQNYVLRAPKPPETRKLVYVGGGRGHGEILRLMSPSDLGGHLKPFVFLDLFAGDMRQMIPSMSLHPHSGIATVTVFTEGDVVYEAPDAGRGTLAYGAVEWMRAGGGVWHGKELVAGDSARTQGFQLWLALAPELENGPVDSQYAEADATPQVGPATVILGTHAGATSPVRSPDGITYLMVRLKPGERWSFQPHQGQSVGWFAVADGSVDVRRRVTLGEIAVFERGDASMDFEADAKEGATFVLGVAVPHDHPLHLGYYSVHTSQAALAMGEKRIAELGAKLSELGDRSTASGNIPVFR